MWGQRLDGPLLDFRLRVRNRFGECCIGNPVGTVPFGPLGSVPEDADRDACVTGCSVGNPFQLSVPDYYR